MNNRESDIISLGKENRTTPFQTLLRTRTFINQTSSNSHHHTTILTSDSTLPLSPSGPHNPTRQDYRSHPYWTPAKRRFTISTSWQCFRHPGACGLVHHHLRSFGLRPRSILSTNPNITHRQHTPPTATTRPDKIEIPRDILNKEPVPSVARVRRPIDHQQTTEEPNVKRSSSDHIP
ncbi:hypothetical protein JAAARDRAFT_59879 [Jaapia argillacea MUCL 33604]|uniref:Uncharacterized protein n=1 Tax=Jaapia argillacea MUCL 33604 TaxID=933084 RepID=A0A067PYE7_9AGAM|nr:hypothetical protein JAAARDRAFT_59879 [Jaapia argillacea MUCL 33604]